MLDDTVDASTVTRDVGGCPVKYFTVFEDQDAGEYWAEARRCARRRRRSSTHHAQGYWVVTRYDAVKDLYQTVDLFSSESFTAWEPNPPYRFVPTQIDPPDHIKYRQLLNPKFSPGAVTRAEEPSREIARRMIAEIAADRAVRLRRRLRHPLPHRGVPHRHRAAAGGRRPAGALGGGLLPRPERRRGAPWPGWSPRWTGSAATSSTCSPTGGPTRATRRPTSSPTCWPSTVDGEPLTDVVLLDMCTVLVLAGLDTTRGQLGYLFQFLAEHPDVRQQILDDPSLMPACIEESLRMHSITIADARKATRDADFHGCPVKAGDMVMGLVSAANRDPRHYADADEFRLDRTGTHHFGFAGGPHRCLGAHLARREMLIAVEEWHAAIPHYRIDSDEPLQERGGQLAAAVAAARRGTSPTKRRTTHEADDRRGDVHRPRPLLHARTRPAELRRRGLRHRAGHDRRGAGGPGGRRPAKPR